MAPLPPWLFVCGGRATLKGSAPCLTSQDRLSVYVSFSTDHAFGRHRAGILWALVVEGVALRVNRHSNRHPSSHGNYGLPTLPPDAKSGWSTLPRGK